MKNDFEDLLEMVMSVADARTAALENDLRRELGEMFERERLKHGLSLRSLASRTDVSPLQIQRLLHKEVGGNLNLRTIVRAADDLGYTLSFVLKEKGL